MMSLIVLGVILLQGAESRDFSVTIPESVKVMRGSCVTIPCSFHIERQYDHYLTDGCKVQWVDSVYPWTPTLTETNPVNGDPKKKICTTTFYNMQPQHSKTYYFRLSCNNELKWTFRNVGVMIMVTDDPPSATLAPSSLKVKEGTSVSLTCSAPAPCLTHPPTLTWTPKLGRSRETLKENQDKTKVQTSVLTFTASHLHHGQKISCSAVYRKQDGSIYTSPERGLTADVSYSPKNIRMSVSPSGPVSENSTVTLACSSDANPAVRIYTWFRADADQETLIGIGPVLSIKVSKVRRTFSCKAENDLGVGHSSLTHIDVQYSPKDTAAFVSPSGPVPKNKNVTLTCSSDANPPAKIYTWFKADGDQETLIGTGPILNIRASKVRQTFFCMAENDLGAGNSSKLYLDVQYAPKEITVSVRPSGPVLEKSVVILTCSSDANPTVRIYTWFRADGDQDTLIGIGPVLSIKASKIRRPFFCRAENDLGFGHSSPSIVDVQYSPQNTTVSVSPSGPVSENSDVTLTCSSDANPPVQNCTWFRADGDQETVIGTGSELKIQASKVKQPLFCIVKNDLGLGVSPKHHINVQYAPKIITVSVRSSGPVLDSSMVTLTCSSEANPAVRRYTWFRADEDQETFIGTGHVLNIEASKVRQPFFCKAGNDLGVGRSNLVHLDVQFPPQILASSNCTKLLKHFHCSCQTVGNPSPTLHWYLDGLPVNQSSKFTVISESLTDTSQRSIITVNQPQDTELSTLFCLSFNSLGSASKQFFVNSVQTPAGFGSNGGVLLWVLAVLSVVFNAICTTVFITFVRKGRRNENPEVEERTYISLDYRDVIGSSECDVIDPK